MDCDSCGDRAVYLRRYSGQAYCAEHFREYFEGKVRKTVHRRKLLKRGERIGVAISGGKDSCTLLYVLDKLKKKYDLELIPIAVDEGIGGYREEAIKAAESLATDLGLSIEVVSFKKSFGQSLDEISKNGDACTCCGVLRRRLLNDAARELGLAKLATGHNLDDEVQAIMMNYVRGDIERLARFGGRVNGGGFVRRIKPLGELPEKEVALYSTLKELGASFDECPYSTSFRSSIRDIVNDLERDNPGIKFSILRGYEKIAPYLTAYEMGDIKKCAKCGEPSSKEICNACSLLEEMRQS